MRLHPFPSRKALGLAVLMAAAALGAPRAQQAPAPAAAPSQETAEEKARREKDLKVLEEAMTANAEARKRLEAEID